MTDISGSKLLLDDYCLKHGTKLVNGVCVFCDMERSDGEPVRYFPIFAGRADGDIKIVLYKSVTGGFHIKVADGELQELSPESELTRWEDPVEQSTRIRLKSPQWSGEIVTNRRDSQAEEGLR